MRAIMRTSVVLALLGAALAVGGCNNTDAPTALTLLTAGSCTGPLESLNAATVSCDQAHHWEVAGLTPLSGDEFPGEEALRQTATQECSATFASYVGVDPNYSAYSATYLAPNAKLWAQPANRQLVCLVGSAAGDLVGSLKGTAASLPMVGQCTGTATDGFKVDLVSCAQPHNYEIYAQKAWTGKKAPTATEFDAFYEKVCVAEFTDFVGLDVGKSTYEIRKFMVPAGVWAKVSDHRLVCGAGSPVEQVTGSLKDAKK